MRLRGLRLISRLSAWRWRLCGGLILIAALGLGACSEQGHERAAVMHPWINAPQTVDDEAVVLAPFLVYRVDGERLAECVDMLKNEPYIQISPAMASYYTGSEVRVPAEMRPFLVRAVATPDASITVVQSMNGLWMKAAGGTGVPGFTPLVVLVDPTPREIYVTVE